MQRSSTRPLGVFQALARPALGAAWLVAGVLAPGTAAAAPEARPRPRVDCSSVPAGAPLPAECRKGGPDADRDGVPDAADRCPAVAEDLDGFEDTDGCPDPDNDGDGLLDDEDGCPLEAEDRDGFKDADGCPEPDNDGDGILDIRDSCPLEAESYDGSGDGDGCPDLLRVSQQLDPKPPPQKHAHAPERPPTMPLMPPQPAPHATAQGTAAHGTPAARAATPRAPAAPHPPAASPPRPATPPAPPRLAARGNLSPQDTTCPDGTTPTPEGDCNGKARAQLQAISETVQFAHHSDRLLEASLPILEQVVDLLDESPHLRVMIVGHADARGRDEANLRLSMLRAVTVRNYLLQQSRDPRALARRLDAVGIGARQPRANNTSAVGRSQNRRVEFLVLDHQPPRPPLSRTPTPNPTHAPAAANTTPPR